MSDEQFQDFHPSQCVILQYQEVEGVRGLAPWSWSIFWVSRCQMSNFKHFIPNQGDIFYLLLQICLGEKKKMKNKNREGKKLKTHALLTRNSFFILFPYFDISLYPIFWIFFLVPVYIFFLFPLFVLPEGFLTWSLLCQHFVGFLYPIFIFFSCPC